MKFFDRSAAFFTAISIDEELAGPTQSCMIAGRFWSFEFTCVNLIDIVKKNLSRSHIAFVSRFHWLVGIDKTLPVYSGIICWPMPTKCALGRLLRNQRIFVSVALDVVLDVVSYRLESFLLDGGVG